MHFCTEKLLKDIYNQKKSIYTLRTGWIPTIYPNDIINLKDKNSDNKIICTGVVKGVHPLRFRYVDVIKHKEELLKYKRKFHPEQWFFIIKIELIPKPKQLNTKQNSKLVTLK